MFLAGVSRIRQPGVKFDQIIVLEGAQGSGKSTALKILAGGDDYFSDAPILGAKSQQQMEALDGVWIYEVCELEGISRADTQKVRAFASRAVERGRPAYGRFVENRPRQCIIVGTTNDHQYLRDQTGNRRFWPVKTSAIDLEAIQRDRDKLWAEAAHWEAKGESIVLPKELWSAAEVEQDERLEDDPWEDILSGVNGAVVGGFRRVSTKDLLEDELQIPAER